MVELLGWGSSFILLATLMRQVYTQWRSGATAGVSKWLFIGQCTASVGYTVYSLLLHNWVYVSSNVAILVTAIVGESLYLRNRRAAARDSQGTSETFQPSA
jgi:MtN3 and saliva related transmembrane protein